MYDDIDPKSSCIKRPSTSTKLPDNLKPLSLETLYSHVRVMFSFRQHHSGETQWTLPGSGSNPSVSFSPEPLVASCGVLIKCDTKGSEVYVKEFLDYFISVKNYIKYQKHFRNNAGVSDCILTHILSFAWTVVTDPPIPYIDQGNELVAVTIHLSSEKLEGHLIDIMKLIRIFSRLDSMCTKIGEKQGLKVILRCMKVRPLCKQLQINCSASLANLASVESNRVTMLDKGCIILILENMTKFMSCPAVQAEVCATLANLSCHEANALYIVRNGGLHAILKAMKLHIDKVDLQVQAFHAIASLGKPGKSILEGEGFVELVVKCISLYEEHVELMSGLWHSIGSLASCGTIIASHKDMFVKKIFVSISRFEKNATFQITACYALAHIFFNHSVQEDSIFSEKGIECLLRVMKLHEDHESVQTTALFALGSMVSKSDALRIAALKSDGIKRVLAAMKKDYTKALKVRPVSEETEVNELSKSEQVTFSALVPPAAEATTIPLNTETTETIEETDVESDSGGPEPVIYARGNDQVKCSKPLLLQLFGSVCLANLSESAPCRDAIILAGGVHFIFQAMNRVREHSDLWLIIHFVFAKFTKCGAEPTVYMKPRGPSSLGELARLRILNEKLKQHLADKDEEKDPKEIFEEMDIIARIDAIADRSRLLPRSESVNRLADILKSPTKKPDEKVQFDTMTVSPYLKARLDGYHLCKECGSGCYETRIRMYEASRTKTSNIQSLCSWKCAQKHKTFSSRPVFYYEPQPDI